MQYEKPMKFMLTFDWSPDTEARAEGIARFPGYGWLSEVFEVVRSVCARHLWALPNQLHPPAAGCVPLMANAERKETWRVWCAKLQNPTAIFTSAPQEARPQISELTQRSAQHASWTLPAAARFLTACA